MTTHPRPEIDSEAHAFERFFAIWFTRVHTFAAHRVGAAEAQLVCERVLKDAVLAGEDRWPDDALAPTLLARTLAAVARVREPLHASPFDSTHLPHARAEAAPRAAPTTLAPRRVSGS